MRTGGYWSNTSTDFLVATERNDGMRCGERANYEQRVCEKHVKTIMNTMNGGGWRSIFVY